MQLPKGLTSEQVQRLTAEGKVNTAPPKASKTIGDIIRDNTLTLFNAVNVLIAIAVFLTGSYRNMLFMGVVISNVVIGVVQEIRSKKAVDQLTIITEPVCQVVRDDELREIPVHEVVLGEVMRLGLGKQICADAVVLEGSVEVNESLLTGESDAVFKQPGDKLLSGSFIVSGECFARAESVGADNFAARLTAEAGVHKKLRSELMTDLGRIIRVTSIAIFPVGAALFCKQHFLLGSDWQSAVLQTAAAMIGMIPEGLILLTSVALAVGVVKLARRRVLVRELYCIETLARVDTLCLDKTGTLTEGEMSVEHLIEADGSCRSAAVRAVSALPKDNATMRALHEHLCGGEEAAEKYERLCPFSSDRKWSGVVFHDMSVMIGAPERLLLESDTELAARAAEYAAQGRRVVAISASSEPIEGFALPESRRTVGMAVITDRIRATAPDTLRYFEEQGVTVKVISGDNMSAVAAIAEAAGVKNAERAIDMSTVPEDADLSEICERNAVFARVSPTQKRSLIKAMKAGGHTVAMTGDGVNDVLSLKEADCSIAMGAGSDAACQVAYLVLLDSDFAALPGVVAEGRRVINNITRTASMFLVKTLYSLMLSVIFLFVAAEYPFKPIQLTLISGLTVGLPSFLLALEPSKERVTGSFIRKVLTRALPGALTVVLGVIASMAAGSILDLPQEQVSTLTVCWTAATSFSVLIRVCMPMSPIRGVMCAALLGAFVAAATLFSWLFMLSFGPAMMPVLIGMLIAVFPVYWLLVRAADALLGGGSGSGGKAAGPNSAARKRKNIYMLLIGVFAAVFICCGVSIAMIQLDYSAGESEYAGIAETYKQEATAAPAPTVTADPRQPEPTPTVRPPAVIDFAALGEVNPDVVGWIEVADTVIDYPVVQAEDNGYYMNRTFEKKRNGSGAIFMDFRNSPDFSDSNTVLYGHNMKNGSMFAELNRYLEQDFADAHPSFRLYTPDAKVYECTVLAAFIADQDYPYRELAFAVGELEGFAEEMRGMSAVSTDAQVTEDDRLLTLSTCSNEGSDRNRTAVIAVMDGGRPVR